MPVECVSHNKFQKYQDDKIGYLLNYKDTFLDSETIQQNVLLSVFLQHSDMCMGLVSFERSGLTGQD